MKKTALVILFVSLLTAYVFAGQEWRQRPSAEPMLAQSDIEEEIRFGREVAARILGRMPLYENAAVNRYVNLVGRAISMNAGRPEIEWHFAVVDSDEINAYAASGGYVFITKGALSVMQDEAELAGVLAHEVAHIAGRHIVKELGIKGTEDSPVAGLARLIGGGTESARVAFFQAVDKAMDILFKDGYKREDEAEADRNAVVLAAMAGYNPKALANYLDRLKRVKKENLETLNRTHPPYDERIAMLNETVAKEGLELQGLRSNPERFVKSTQAVR